MNGKEYECVEVKQHKDVGKTIAEYQKNGWHLHTYQAAGLSGGPITTFLITTCYSRKTNSARQSNHRDEYMGLKHNQTKLNL